MPDALSPRARSTICRLAALLALAIVTVAPAAAQSGWSDAGWSARCASTSVLTRLSSISRGWARPADCLFSYIDPKGIDRVLLVSAETRRAVEAVMDDIARWYDERGFPAPHVRRAGDPPLVVSDAEWRAGYVEIETLPHDRGRGDQAFEVQLDPMPDPDGDHEHTEGFYFDRFRVMVVRIEPVQPPPPAPADPGANAEPSDQQATEPQPEPPVPPPPVGLAVADPDTLAHEMFHAISYGLHGGNYARFVEEGLAEMYGVLYAAERSGRPGPHWLTARFGDGRFSRAPLMSDDGNDPYDTAPFWRFVHRQLGSDAGRWIRVLLGDHDLTGPVNASGAVDAWLRDTLGQPLNDVWAAFLEEVSREATRAGVMDTLVECRDATLSPSDDDPERVFDVEVAGASVLRFTARCLRIELPLAGEWRELTVENLTGGADLPGLRIAIEGDNLIGRTLMIDPTVTSAELIVFPWRDDAVAVPALDQTPGFRIVLKGLATGCDQDRAAMRSLPRDRLDLIAASAGTWREMARSYTHVGPAPGCTFVQFPETYGAAAQPTRFVHDVGVLGLFDGQLRLVPLDGPPSHRAIPVFSDLCGPLVPSEVAGSVRMPDAWVRDVEPDAQVFHVESGRHCTGYAVVGPRRGMVATLLHAFPGTPEQWEVLLFERPD